MAVTYPDAVGEHINNPVRFFEGGLQYVGYIEPSDLSRGQTANLYLFFQNVLNVPLTVGVRIIPPRTGFFSGKKPILAIDQTEIDLEIGPAEAGLLTIPAATTQQAKQGNHKLSIEVKAKAKGRGDRIRPTKSKSSLPTKLIDDPVGLNLIGSLGANYVEKSAKRAGFPVKITSERVAPDPSPDLSYSYQPVWTGQDAQNFGKATHEIHARQVKLEKELSTEALYANFYSEGVKRFANVGLPLRVGEAITLAKILTYSCRYFLNNPNLANGYLVPIWERALEVEMDTTDSLNLVRTLGFHHTMRLAVAMSFGLIARAVGKHIWPLEERQMVGRHISDTIELGESLHVDFLYLPLLIAGTQIAGKLAMPGEDVKHTVALINQAKQARNGLFEETEMASARKLYEKVLKKQLA